MPEFRYLMLINECKSENDNIFPYLQDKTGAIFWNGSVQDTKTFVPPGTPSATLTYDLTLFSPRPKTQTLLILGGCMKNTTNQATDNQHKWTYNESCRDTVVAIYHEDKTLAVDPLGTSDPNAVTSLGDYTPTSPSKYQIIDGQALGKFFAAVGGLVSREV